MDIKLLDTRKAATEGRECIIRMPDGSPTDIKIILAGLDSDLFKEMNDKLQREVREALKRNREFELSPDEERERDWQRMANATLGWSGVEEDGKELPFAKENARRIYEQYPLIFRQVLAFVGGEANFLPMSLKSLSKLPKRN